LDRIKKYKKNKYSYIYGGDCVNIIKIPKRLENDTEIKTLCSDIGEIIEKINKLQDNILNKSSDKSNFKPSAKTTKIDDSSTFKPKSENI
jgi:hypothetical protein